MTTGEPSSSSGSAFCTVKNKPRWLMLVIDLHLTVVFDHDVIDGAPMVRFIADLVGLLESGASAVLP